MTRYVAFLRGINVSGHKMIKMEDLRSYFGDLPGIQNIATYIQTGNVLFQVPHADEAVLRLSIEALLEAKLGYKVTCIIRKHKELEQVVKNNPFDTIKTEDKAKLYVTFLADLPAPDLRDSLDVYASGAEYARIVDREVYVVSTNYGKTRFSNSFIEKKLKLCATTRNWATINKMIEL